MKLNELFDKVVDVQWGSTGDWGGSARFNIGGVDYGFEVQSQGDPNDMMQSAWKVSFFTRVDNAPSWVNTNTGNQFAVYSTVISLMKQFMEKEGYLPFVMDTADAGRNSLYQRMLRKFVPGWRVENTGKALVVYPPAEFIKHEEDDE